MKKILVFFFMLGALTSYAANGDDIETIVEQLLGKMTLEEKVRLSYASQSSQALVYNVLVYQRSIPAMDLMACVWKSTGTTGIMPDGLTTPVRHSQP